jgi:hypothetical protein
VDTLNRTPRRLRSAHPVPNPGVSHMGEAVAAEKDRGVRYGAPHGRHHQWEGACLSGLAGDWEQAERQLAGEVGICPRACEVWWA